MPVGSTLTVYVDGTSDNDALTVIAPAYDGSYATLEMILFGHEGDDRLTVSPGPQNWRTVALGFPDPGLTVANFVYGDVGNDTLVGTDGFHNLPPALASAYAFSTVLYGGDGCDTYILLSHNDSAIEDAGEFSGTDTLIVTERYRNEAIVGLDVQTFDLGSGSFANIENVRLQGLNNFETVIGTDAANTIIGNQGNNLLQGLGDYDELVGNGGDDSLEGGTGDDDLYGGGGADSLVGGDGYNFLNGGADNDILIGGDPSGSTGDLGINTLTGGLGDDSLTAGQNGDELYGGLGNNTLNGGAGNDILIASSGNDSLIGGGGDDFLKAGLGDNRVEGGAGWNVFQSVSAGDTLLGGADSDVYLLQSRGLVAQVIELEDGGNDLVVALAASLNASNFANVEALAMAELGRGNFSITGGGSVVLMEGNLGNNRLDGTAQSLAQTIDGYFGNDSLFGGSGDDTVIGGGGADILMGGAGADIFAYDVDAIAPSGLWTDHITDFQTGIDKVDLVALGMMIESDPVTAATGLVPWYMFDSASGSTDLWVDVNGDLAFDVHIIFDPDGTGNAPLVTSADLLLGTMT